MPTVWWRARISPREASTELKTALYHQVRRRDGLPFGNVTFFFVGFDGDKFVRVTFRKFLFGRRETNGFAQGLTRIGIHNTQRTTSPHGAIEISWLTLLFV